MWFAIKPFGLVSTCLPRACEATSLLVPSTSINLTCYIDTNVSLALPINCASYRTVCSFPWRRWGGYSSVVLQPWPTFSAECWQFTGGHSWYIKAHTLLRGHARMCRALKIRLSKALWGLPLASLLRVGGAWLMARRLMARHITPAIGT